MATVRDFTVEDAPNAREQGDVSATVRLIEVGGERFIQIDTYGSPERQEVGKQSQTIRLSEAAFKKLIALGSKHF